MRATRVRKRVERSFGDPVALEMREREIAARIRGLTGSCAAPHAPASPLVWPLRGQITSGFGDRFGRLHAGIDIAGPEGAVVVAASDGHVILAEHLPDFGNTLIVDHGDGFVTLYAHLRESLVRVGDAVACAHAIGLVGSTGRVTGPHLHFEIRLDAAPCDPATCLPPEGDPSSALRGALMRTFGELLAGAREVVLVGSPLHANAGDSLIWLGQLSLLSRLGISVRAVVHPASYDRRPFDASAPDAVVLLSGGGNFGDVWPFVHRHREWVLREITDRRVLQMPQSLQFLDEANLRSTQAALSRRGDVVLGWRDDESARAAGELFPGTRSILAPDIAFARRPPRVPLVVDVPILCVARTDQEGGVLGAADLPDDVQRVDWSVDGLDRAARQALWLTARAQRRVPWLLGSRLATVPHNRSALITVAHAARTIGRARVAMSDRLHVHVLCTMLGIPHVMLDSGYGKIRSFVESWPVTRDVVELASTPGDAVERARRLLADVSADDQPAVG